MATGALSGTEIGPDTGLTVIQYTGGVSTSAIESLNEGIAFRFTARSTLDVKSVRLSWATATTPGTVQVSIQTIDAATGKPSGSLYDEHATKDITPAAGTQTYTFSADGGTQPHAGMTVGTEYAVVIITTVAGTAHALNSVVTSSYHSKFPTCFLTTADAGTSWTEGASVPICSLVMEDDSEEATQFIPYAGAAANGYCYTTYFAALKITTLTAYSVSGVAFSLVKAGTPAGNLIVDIRDTSNNVITGTSRTIDKDSLITNASTRRVRTVFDAPITLPAGTYYLCCSSPDSANSSNCWNIKSWPFLNSAAVGSYRAATSSNSGTAWTDSTTHVSPMWLAVEVDVAPDFPAAANVLTSDTTNGVTGTYHAPEASEVWYGADVGTTTGTKRASSIANCSAGNVKKDVTIDDVVGTYEGAGAGGIKTHPGMGGGVSG